MKVKIAIVAVVAFAIGALLMHIRMRATPALPTPSKPGA